MTEEKIDSVKTPRVILLEAIALGTERRDKQLAEYAKEVPAWIEQKLIPGIRDACAKGQKLFEIGLSSDDRTPSRAAGCVQWGLAVNVDTGKTYVTWDGLLEPVVEKKKAGRPPKVVDVPDTGKVKAVDVPKVTDTDTPDAE